MKNTPIDNVVELDTPIKRGEQKITSIELRKPQSGELRGVHLGELLQLDVNSLIKVLPRISIPTLTEPEVAAMDPADLLAAGTKVAGFLLQKAARTEASLGA
ncbi:phage tail assembly protein [Pseudomonas tohonis]|nr:phage tail assembly protein [Pseudomonas tohonis]